MSQLGKFTLIGLLVVALSGLGVLTVTAADRTVDHSAALQQEGGAWLGVAIEDAENGARIVEVAPGSPAEDAGLAADDVITAVDGTTVDSAASLTSEIQSHQPGDEVVLTLADGDTTRDVSVTLGERPTTMEEPVPVPNDVQPPMGMLSFFAMEVSMTDEGMRIDSIDADSPAANLGFQEDDIITAINGTAIVDLNPRDLMGLLRGSEEVTFTVLRDGEEIEVTIDLSEIIEQMPMIPDDAMPFAQVVPSAYPLQLGVSYLPITAENAAELDLPVEEGALIEEVVADSPAEEAGLQQGDIITAVDGDAVDEEHTLADRLYAYEEDDTVSLTVLRDGEEMQIEATLGPSPRDSSTCFNYGMGPGRGRGMGSDEMPYYFCMPMMQGQGFRFGPGMHGFSEGEMPGWFFDMHPFMDQQDDSAPQAVPDEPPAVEDDDATETSGDAA